MIAFIFTPIVVFLLVYWIAFLKSGNTVKLETILKREESERHVGPKKEKEIIKVHCHTNRRPGKCWLNQNI